MSIVPDVVDAQLRLQFLGRDVVPPSVMASDPAHDPNALPVEALPVKKPHVLSIYTPAFRATGIQKQREHEGLVSHLLRLKRKLLRNAPRPENSLLQLRSRVLSALI